MLSPLVFCSFLGFIATTFCLFDKLVAFEFKHYKQYWIRDGKPIGFLWQPKEPGESWFSMLFFGSLTRSRLSIQWIVITPIWAITDIKARRILKQFRVSGYLAFSAGVLWVVVVFVY